MAVKGQWALGPALAAAEAYANEYEFDDAEGGYHCPTEIERLVMIDMLNGLFSEDAFLSALSTAPSLAVSDAKLGAGEPEYMWAVLKWNDEVANRPLQNVHRRSLDDTWRQVIRHYGGDDVRLCGPTHDDLVASGSDGVEAGEPVQKLHELVERLTKERDQMRRERDGASQSRLEATIEGARRVRALGVEKHQMEVRLRADLETAERLLAEATGALEKAERRFDSIRGAVESNQVVDKDVRGNALRGREECRTTLSNIRGHNG